MTNDVSTIPLGAFQDIIGPHCNPFLTIAVSGNLAPGTLQFVTTGIGGGGPHERVLSAITYLKHLHGVVAPTPATVNRDVRFVFQAEDVPVNVPSASWEAMTSWHDVTLIPDLYYFQARGYEDSSPIDIPWHDRESRIVWRGSTTGLLQQRIEDLDSLPRYRLCKIVSQLGAVADVGLNAAVQAVDPEQEQQITDRLRAEGLLKPFVPMAEMAQCRYIMDIDGNSNSWNFMMKLRLGCCVLRVESDWQQWFASRLVPWVHYVPIAKDLSDAASKIAWCLDNPAESAAIAQRGTAFARDMRFSDEMATAAAAVFGLQQPR